MVCRSRSGSHILEVRNVTFTCTVAEGSGCSRLISPPQVVSMVRDVSFEVVSGEVHALIGSDDSGRNLLLEIISGTADGDTAGSIQLNNFVLNRDRFQKLCSFLSGRHRCPGFMTVHSFLYYTAALTFHSSLSADKIDKRVHMLMRQFDLLGYSHDKLQNLSVSAQRRALLAYALIKDPVLLVVEDPCDGLEPISSYQLMYCLRIYAAEHNRIVLVSMGNPRSDLCQVISSLTMLFQGAVLYSGRVKNLPTYFQDVALPCPENENPAMYYLSLTTLSYETQSGFDRTQAQALHMVELFKTQSPPLPPSRFRQIDTDDGGTVALCFLARPSATSKFLVLARRSFLTITSWQCSLLLRIALLPVLMLVTALFSTNLLSGSWISPYTSFRILEVSLLISYCTSTLLALICYESLLSLSVAENCDCIYNKSLSFLSYMCTVFGIDVVSSLLSAAILLCISNIVWPVAILRTAIVLLCVFLSAHLITMTAMLYIRDSLTCAALSIFVFTLCLLFGSGLLRSLPAVPSHELDYIFYLNPLRHANFILTVEISSQLPVRNCARTERNGLDATPVEKFCRVEQFDVHGGDLTIDRAIQRPMDQSGGFDDARFHVAAAGVSRPRFSATSTNCEQIQTCLLELCTKAMQR
uniref:ABC transporter domain-containing protein n=1 Tax=Haemonchus contortus TaxID=6289 RepID=A0A7I5E6T8_HAECO